MLRFVMRHRVESTTLRRYSMCHGALLLVARIRSRVRATAFCKVRATATTTQLSVALLRHGPCSLQHITQLGWLDGSVVRDREVASSTVSWLVRYQVTTLGKLFTPTCLWSVKVHVAKLWLSGLVVSALGIRTRGPRFDSQVAPLIQLNSQCGSSAS